MVRSPLTLCAAAADLSCAPPRSQVVQEKVLMAEWLEGLKLNGAAPRGYHAQQRAQQHQQLELAVGLSGLQAAGGKLKDAAPTRRLSDSPEGTQQASTPGGGTAAGSHAAGEAIGAGAPLVHPLLQALQQGSGSSQLRASDSALLATGSASLQPFQGEGGAPPPALSVCLVGEPDGYPSAEAFYFACVRPAFGGYGPLKPALELLDKHCKHEV